MEFFNKKEDVLDIELTPFGEVLLSKGKFKPEYYAFFDDGILYDAEYADVTESQNEAKKRIKEVPRLKTQYQFRGGEFPKYRTQIVEEEFPDQTIEIPGIPGSGPIEICALFNMTTSGQQIIPGTEKPKEEFLLWLKDEGLDPLPSGMSIQCREMPGTGTEGIPSTFDTIPGGIITEHQYPDPVFAANVLPLPLGLCEYNTDFAPAWDLKMLYGEISGSVEMLTSAMHPYLKIPQVNVNVVYESYVGPSQKTADPDTSKYKLREFQEIHDSRHIYTDGTSIYFDEDCAVLEINEEHVPFLKENFDIEVYRVENQPTISQEGKAGIVEQLVPLSFLKPTMALVGEDGLLMNYDKQLAAQEQELQLQLQRLDNSFVEHYFNIWVDSDIDNDLMCKVKPAVKKKGLFITDPLECENNQQGGFSINSVYTTPQEDTTPECDE